MKNRSYLKGERRAQAISIFSARLKELRLTAKLSQTKLSWRLDVGQELVSRWERGKVLPTFYYLKKIALMFNVRIEDLIGAEID